MAESADDRQAGDERDVALVELEACARLLGIAADRPAYGPDSFARLTDPDGLLGDPAGDSGRQGACILCDALLDRLRNLQQGQFELEDWCGVVRYVFAALRKSRVLVNDVARAEVLVQVLQLFAASGGSEVEAQRRHAELAFVALVLLVNAVAGAPLSMRWNAVRLDALVEVVRTATDAGRASALLPFLTTKLESMAERYWTTRMDDSLEMSRDADDEPARRRLPLYEAVYRALTSIGEPGGREQHAAPLMAIETGIRLLACAAERGVQLPQEEQYVRDVCLRALLHPRYFRFEPLQQLEAVQRAPLLCRLCRVLAEADGSALREAMTDAVADSDVVMSTLRSHQDEVEAKMRLLMINALCLQAQQMSRAADATHNVEAADAPTDSVPYDAIAAALQSLEGDSMIDDQLVEDWVVLTTRARLVQAKLDQVQRRVRVLSATPLGAGDRREDWRMLNDKLSEWRDRLSDMLSTVQRANHLHAPA
eukprot:ctg_672.g375